MAKNKFEELSSTKSNTYKKIMEQIQTLKQIKDFPPKYIEKMNEYEAKLKVPEKLILDSDVEDVEQGKEYEKIVKNPISLDDILTSLNLAEN